MNTDNDTVETVTPGSPSQCSGADAPSERTPDAGSGATAPASELGSTEMEFHPIAGLFPLMGDEDLVQLAASIKETGLQQPIWTYEGKIIDGRNRYRACLKAGVKPVFREWDGKGALVDFVVSLNLHRRHLTTSQRAMIAADIATLKPGRRANVQGCTFTTVAMAAKAFRISSRLVSEAKVIANKGERELIDRVKAGDLSVTQAAKIADRSAAEQRADLTRPRASATACRGKPPSRSSDPGKGTPAGVPGTPSPKAVSDLDQYLMLAFKLAELCGFADVQAAIEDARRLFNRKKKTCAENRTRRCGV